MKLSSIASAGLNYEDVYYYGTMLLVFVSRLLLTAANKTPKGVWSALADMCDRARDARQIDRNPILKRKSKKSKQIKRLITKYIL